MATGEKGLATKLNSGPCTIAEFQSREPPTRFRSCSPMYHPYICIGHVGVLLSSSRLTGISESRGRNSAIECRSRVQYQSLVISPCRIFPLSCEFQLTEQAIGVYRPSTGTGHSHAGSYVAPVLYIIYIYTIPT